MVTVESADHEFGGISTDLKLSLVEGYLHGFTVALKNKYQLIYIDAFAGTGVRTVKHRPSAGNLWDGPTEGRIERLRGSAQIAIDVVPPFDQLVFIDRKKSHHRALLNLKVSNPERSILVERGDANQKIIELISSRRWTNARAVLFLDPYGMHVDWETLKAIQATKAMDVWYLVSLEGLYRQAALDRSKITPKKRAAITRMLGTPDWEDAWYADRPAKNPTVDLLSCLDLPAMEANMRRSADIADISLYVRRRLRTVFPAVLEPLMLNNKAGVPAFLLFFAMSNPSGAAISVASRIANHLLKAGSVSQVRPRN